MAAKAAPPESAPARKVKQGRHDSAARRKGLRTKGQRGCSIYIPAEELLKAGVDPWAEEPPYYRIWAGPRGRVVIQLYREGP